MVDTLQTKDSGILEGNLPHDATLAVDLGKLLADHHGGEVLVMDMRSLNFWTDFFVIATVTSNTHLSGLERHIKEFAREREAEILHRSRRPKSLPQRSGQGPEPRLDEWCLLDFGTVVVHLMSANARSFFELERLWSAAPLIYRGGQAETR